MGRPSRKQIFEQYYPQIERVVESRRYRWQLKANLMLDYDDVKSMIIYHCFKKFHLYDRTKAIEPWVSSIADRQIINILRNNWGSTASPCSRCSCNLGASNCSLYGEQNDSCTLFSEWNHTKRHRHEARLPLPMENHMNEIKNKSDDNINVEDYVDRLHERMEKALKPNEWKIYTLLYIQHLNEEETAIQMGYKTNEKNRKIGYKRVRQIKNIIIQKAKRILQVEGIF